MGMVRRKELRLTGNPVDEELAGLVPQLNMTGKSISSLVRITEA